jgi:hypothetical protein
VVVDDRGVKVDLREALDYEIQDVGFVQPGDLLGQLEALDEDLADVSGEALDVAVDVGGDVVRVALEAVEIELRDVVKVNPGDAVEDRRRSLTLPLLSLACWARTLSLVSAKTQSRRRKTVNGRITLPKSCCLKVPRMRSAIDQRKLDASEKLWNCLT